MSKATTIASQAEETDDFFSFQKEAIQEAKKGGGEPTDDQKESKKESEEEEKEVPKTPRVAEIPSDEEVEKRSKKTRGTQFKELRERKDELEKENEELKKRLEGSGEGVPETLRTLFEEDFKDAEDPYSNLVESYKTNKQKLAEIEKEREAERERLREISIKNDPDFIKEYQQPFDNSINSLRADIYEVDSEGKPVNAAHFQKLYDSLIAHVDQNNGEVDGLKIKSILSAFKDKYETETGEEWNPPAVGNIANSLRDIVAKFKKLQGGVSKYEQNKTELKEKRQLQEQKEIEEKEALRAQQRKSLALDLFENFEYDKFSVIAEEKEIKEGLQESYNKVEEMFSDPSKSPTVPDLISTQWKVSQFDKLLAEYTELKERLSEYEEDDRSNLPASSQGTGAIKKEEGKNDDWLD